jgi:hypothetical protein
MSKKIFTTKLTNAVEPPAPTSVWGYKGVPGKGGKTRNSIIISKSNTKEND